MTSELRDKKKQKREPVQRFNGVEFVQYELNKEQREDLRKRVASGEFGFDALSKLVEEGYRVSFKWDDYSSCQACFINPPDDSGNAGKCLTGRGRLSQNAFIEALYKHYVVFDGVWPNRQTPKGYEAWDD